MAKKYAQGGIMRLRITLMAGIVLLSLASSAWGAGSSENMDVGTQQFVVTMDNADETNLLQLSNTLKMDDGTTVARFYFVDRSGKSYGGIPVIQKSFMKYDCKAGTFILTGATDVSDAHHNGLGIITVPPGVKPFIAREHPDVAQMWGYNDFCNVPGSKSSPRRSGNWTKVVWPLLDAPRGSPSVPAQAQPH